ncbi:hypothetical protein ES705_08179 [subsurface metagenome]
MVKIVECDLNNPEHRKAVIDLMNHYMADTMGGKLPPHAPGKAEKMVEGLDQHPSKLVLLAEYKGEFAGLSTSFINYGTFSVKPFINIHDIVVLSKYRGEGIGRKLMEGIIEKAKQFDCGKITMEVREDNIEAQQLYKSFGFDESKPVMHFWTKHM